MRMTRRAAIVLFAIGWVAALYGVAWPQDGAPAGVNQELKALKQFGAAHKECQAWTNGCAQCVLRSDGSLGCTRLGVDCEVTAVQCTQAVRDPKTGKTPQLPQ